MGRSTSPAAIEVGRIKTNYVELLDAISAAFDERRVRESDAMQRATGLLNIALGAIGVVTVIDAIARLKPDETATAATLLGGEQGWSIGLVIGTLAIGAALFGFLIFAVVTFVRNKLGSPTFREIYHKLLPHMMEASTHGLECIRHELSGPANGKAWDEHDRKLCEQFIALWRPERSANGRSRDPRVHRDIEVLSEQVEEWTVRSLLLVRGLLAQSNAAA